jgi:hypothetical protein
MNGNFTIDLDDSLNTCTFKMSSIQYEALKMKVVDFKKRYKNGDAVYLAQKNSELAEVTVRPGKWEHKHLGITAHSNKIVGAFDTCGRGYETGVLMHIKEGTAFIDSVQVNISAIQADSFFFRVNIYEQIDTEFVNILKAPIYVNISAAEIKDKHKIVIDLSKLNIVVAHDFMASVELLKDYGQHRIFFCAGLLTNNGYSRKTSQGYWYNIPHGAAAISAYVRD